ncbi:chromate efflux transporter [Methylobacterium gnaphalii]|uniref:Chromate transporter n=1 Tax=Methylobacterium gnaphalii TaxID=1010610 RepID=A0A512JHV2_9HYPH|nr:chromate efflux transporter [Methylobacterium gnaphalii]GEP09538.1 chromate transporter [Methylobacterium gnaphalii]GJD69943.1 putative chromate transport protein [Methylobacterium gnaphalii]GLS48164.1 chromate transporter [Methylobacterium gnaphalii]
MRPPHGVTLAEATRIWARIALLSFGGPAGQIAVMHRILVDERRWIGEARFLHALSYCTLLPGPEAQQLATYIGWLMHRTVGGLIAGSLFVLPGAVSIMALSLIYVAFGQTGVVAGLFFGLKCAVLAVVLQAVVRVGSRALRNRVMQSIAALAFVAIFVLSVPFPLIVLAAGIAGYAAVRLGSAAFGSASHRAAGTQGASDADSLLAETIPEHARPDAAWSLRIAAVLALLWLVPVALLVIFASGSAFADIAVFFSKMAVVTFGGAYAALAYVAQAGVETYGWLRPGEMLDGLGMAETTPGPLIMVTQFVGFLGAFRAPGGLNPYLAGVLGGLLTTWVTFVPCFLWIFAGAPYVEALRGNQALSGALAAITAAVVGVILNLAVWFALHTLFADVQTLHPGIGLAIEWPVLASVNLPALLLTTAAVFAVFRLNLGMIPTLFACSCAGIALHLAGIV